MIEPGQPAPDFTLPDQDGTSVSLSDFAGRIVVLYFHPKVDTPDIADPKRLPQVARSARGSGSA